MQGKMNGNRHLLPLLHPNQKRRSAQTGNVVLEPDLTRLGVRIISVARIPQNYVGKVEKHVRQPV